MAGTLADMKARILSELANRSDMPPFIETAITDAIAVNQKYRFRFSTGNIQVSTVPGTAGYQVSGIFAIDYALINVNGQVIHLSRKQPELVRLKLQVQSGTPTMYAWEQELVILAPTPTAINVLALIGFILVPAPANDATVGNRWMTDGERLIRYYAKAKIFRDVLRNKDMADQMDAAYIAERDQMLRESGYLDLYQGMQMRDVKIPETP